LIRLVATGNDEFDAGCDRGSWLKYDSVGDFGSLKI